MYKFDHLIVPSRYPARNKRLFLFFSAMIYHHDNKIPTTVDSQRRTFTFASGVDFQAVNKSNMYPWPQSMPKNGRRITRALLTYAAFSSLVWMV